LCLGRCFATNQKLAFLNVYGPCLDKSSFWTHLADSGILSLPNLILGGDLNLTLSSDEHWDSSSLSASGINPFRDLFNAFNLIDIVPVKLAPTWRNGRRGTEAIAKRLDRFLLSDALFSYSVSPTSRVVLPFLSDHAPILITLNLPFRYKPFPFKYNHHWADFLDFTALVHSVWSDQRFHSEANPQLRITWKLNVLKTHTKDWQKRKKEAEVFNLNRLESEISHLITKSFSSAL